MHSRPPPLTWIAPGEPFPALSRAWGPNAPAPGLLAAGGSLDVDALHSAYAQGIFPWFSEGQPILWWSPDPRMVLPTDAFIVRRSLRKTLAKFRADPACEIRFDSDFRTVIRACASSPREGQNGTWIVPDMVRAYDAFHRAGYAHSVETWIDGELAGGLYCVAIGRAVFGESMFMRVTDASKIALAALVAFCRHHGIGLVDCQQNTRHLASLGAHEIPRADFAEHVARARLLPPPRWQFDLVYWNHLADSKPQPA